MSKLIVVILVVGSFFIGLSYNDRKVEPTVYTRTEQITEKIVPIQCAKAVVLYTEWREVAASYIPLITKSLKAGTESDLDAIAEVADKMKSNNDEISKIDEKIARAEGYCLASVGES